MCNSIGGLDMIDDKKIEEAKEEIYEDRFLLNGEDVIFDNDAKEEMYYKEDIKEAIGLGAKWMREEFLKDLLHDAEEEPKHDKQITYVWGNGIAKTIILNEEADKFNRTPSQIWHNICKNYKVARWLYVDDLLPKKGGKQ